jgi:GntR family transcriptional regulator
MKTMLKHKGIPLYYQVETVLRNKILSGELPRAVTLPSEDALAEEYQVSRITIRQALSLLEKDGLVVRKRGKGTFVSEKATIPRSPKWNGFMEDLILMGIETTTKVLDMSTIYPPEVIEKKLKLAEGAQVLRIEKIRLVEQSPFSYMVNYLPADIGRKITPDDLAAKPLLMILEENLGLAIAKAVQTVEATIADSRTASLLDIRVGDPLLKVEKVVYDPDQRPIECVFVLYRADKYFFTVNLKRKRSKKSVGWQTV